LAACPAAACETNLKLSERTERGNVPMRFGHYRHFRNLDNSAVVDATEFMIAAKVRLRTKDSYRAARAVVEKAVRSSL
jgi:hypothetical protein